MEPLFLKNKITYSYQNSIKIDQYMIKLVLITYWVHWHYVRKESGQKVLYPAGTRCLFIQHHWPLTSVQSHVLGPPGRFDLGRFRQKKKKK